MLALIIKMTIKTLTIFFIWIILKPLTSYSNGGPVDISHFRKTGNIRLLRKADVSLLKENLTIKVIGDYTEIEVEYQLKNNGNQQQIQYGFPVDAYETDWHYGDPGWPIFEGDNQFVEHFRVLANGQDIKVTNWVIDSIYSAQSTNLNEALYNSPKQYTILRKWYSTTIDFTKGETKELKVLYKIKNTMRDKMPGFCFIHRFTDRHFTYDLSPSSNWGDGIVREFTLKIDLTDIASIGAGYSVTGIDNLKNTNNLYSYNMTEYNLNKSDRIDIHYNNSHIKLSEFIITQELPKDIIKSVKSSSNQSTVKNLLDNSHITTWTGKPGDWIEIEFQRNQRKNGKGYISPAGILVLNGDYSSKENFDKSGKMKNVKVIVNDSIAFNTEPWEGGNGKRIIKLDKPVFREVNEKYIPGLAIIIADGDGLGWYRSDGNYKIRIEILTVDGNARKEVTLSELYFVGQ